MQRELGDLQERIEEAGGVATAQIELSKKRETEIAKLQTDANALVEENERTVSDMKKKHQQALNDMQEQVKQHFVQ